MTSLSVKKAAVLADGTPPAGAPPAGAPQGARAAGRGLPAGITAGGTALTDPEKLHAASEKDVMNVLDMIRKEFNVDENRTYLMGHSIIRWVAPAPFTSA